MAIMQPPVASAMISVTRCRDGTVEGHFPAHRLALPDGRCGVRWAGLVFPLHPGDRVEVTDRAFLPGDCRPWAPQPGWRVVAEPGASDAYVFLDGPASARDRMLAAMAAAALQPVRSGPNMSGMPGDWFIRVQGWSERAEQALADRLGAAAAHSAEDPARLRERLVQERFEQVAAERDALRQGLSAIREQLARAMDKVESSDAARAALQGELQRLMERVEAPPERAHAEPAPPRSATAAVDREVATVMEHLLPRIDLVRDSLKLVCIELADRRGLWRGLAELDRAERGTPAAWKTVRGADGWIERHFSNGQDNQGRLYARHDAARWQVLVSHKQEQPSDMRWLRQQG